MVTRGTTYILELVWHTKGTIEITCTSYHVKLFNSLALQCQPRRRLSQERHSCLSSRDYRRLLWHRHLKLQHSTHCILARLELSFFATSPSHILSFFFVKSPNHYLIRCLTTAGNGTYYGSPLNLQSILLHRHPQSLCQKLCILVLWDPRRLLLPRYTSSTWICSHLPTRVFQRRLSVLPISRVKFSPP